MKIWMRDKDGIARLGKRFYIVGKDGICGEVSAEEWAKAALTARAPYLRVALLGAAILATAPLVRSLFLLFHH